MIFSNIYSKTALILAALLLLPAVGEAKILFTGYGDFRMTAHTGSRIYGSAPADALAWEAATAIKSIAAGQDTSEPPRIRTAPPGGKVVYNGSLAEKWKIQPPIGAPWRIIR